MGLEKKYSLQGLGLEKMQSSRFFECLCFSSMSLILSVYVKFPSLYVFYLYYLYSGHFRPTFSLIFECAFFPFFFFSFHNFYVYLYILQLPALCCGHEVSCHHTQIHMVEWNQYLLLKCSLTDRFIVRDLLYFFCTTVSLQESDEWERLDNICCC